VARCFGSAEEFLEYDKPCLGCWGMVVNLTRISDLETRNGDDQFAGVVANRAGTNEEIYEQEENTVN
jgi:hypothetical protein